MRKTLTFWVLLVSMSAMGQKSVRKAETCFNKYSYPRVIELLQDKDNLSTTAYRQLAESHRRMGNYAAAETAYAKVNAATDRTAEDVYMYAQILTMNGKYAEARKQMEIYANIKPTDSRAKLFQQNLAYAEELLKDKQQFRIKNLSMNSEQQDFGVTYYKDQLIYVSSQTTIGPAYRRWNGNGLGFLNLYSAKAEPSGEISGQKKIRDYNKKYHEGPASYNKEGTRMMYTRDNYGAKSKEGVRHLELMEVQSKEGTWRKPTDFTYNNKDYSVGHPSLSADGTTLYFASDMPGGMGGVDLYVSKRQPDGSWSKPENLGDKINTEGDELFPFLHESGLFFFSSNGRPGLGGMDVFATVIKNGGIAKVINVGVPVNSSKDDISFAMNADKTKGYFSSNREGGKGSHDLYSFDLLKPFQFMKLIKGTARDNEGTILSGVIVTLSAPWNTSQTPIDTVLTAEDGTFSFEVEVPTEYVLSGKKERYLEGKNVADVTEEKETVIADVILEKHPNISLYAIVTDGATKRALGDVKISIVDAAKKTEFEPYTTTASGDYRKALPENRVGDQLEYTIQLEKEGYLTKEVIFTYKVTKPGEIRVHELMDLTLSVLKVGSDIAKMIDMKPIYFDLNKYDIRPDAAIELNKIIKIMNENPNMVVELGSHSDCRGTKASNEILSDKRAKASAAYIKKSIAHPERISGKGYGESKLKNGCACEGAVKSTCTEEEHQENRRTEFIIIRL